MFRPLLVIFMASAMIVSAQADELFVSAAASLTDAMKEISAHFEKGSGTKVTLNFGASSALARQMEEGAPVDVFVSADEAQMDRVAKLLAPGTRQDLLTNTLVIIARKDSDVRVEKLSDLTNPKIGRIAIADPKAVPAGVYAHEVLTKAGLWEKIESNIVPAENVRATLAVVESGNAGAGFVYKTDALVSSKVRIVMEIPAEIAPKIVYPMAILQNTAHRETATRFLAFLKSPEAAEVFQRAGFGLAK